MGGSGHRIGGSGHSVGGQGPKVGQGTGGGWAGHKGRRVRAVE